MKISIAMTTYNGERFLEKQLLSCLHQTIKPDELIIVDDASTDKTVHIIKEFISLHQLENWHLYINAHNVGWRQNFMYAIGKTSGDIVFLADQDDIWMEDKIEVMEKAMQENDYILALGGYQTVINEFDQTVVGTYPYPISSNSKMISKIEFNEKNCFLIKPGCVTAFRRSIYPHMQALWMDSLAHDVLVWRIACIMEGAYSIDYLVLKYRVHSANNSGVALSNYIGQKKLEQRITEIESEQKWARLYLAYFSNINIIDKSIKLIIIQKGIDFWEKRKQFLLSKNIFKGLALIKYIKFYPAISKYIGDLLYAYRLNKVGGNIYWKVITRQ